MSKKILVLVLTLASLAIFLPAEGKAAVSGEKNSVNAVAEFASPQIRVRIGQPRRRYYRRYPRRVVVRRYYGPRRTRVVRRVYYRNGRRY